MGTAWTHLPFGREDLDSTVKPSPGMGIWTRLLMRNSRPVCMGPVENTTLD